MAPFYCNLCQINCGNAYNYQTHMGGRPHKRQQELQRQQIIIDTDKERILQAPVSFYCSTCAIDFGSNEANFNSHQQGKQHRKKAVSQLLHLATPNLLKRCAATEDDNDYEPSPKRKQNLNITYSITNLDNILIEESVLEIELNKAIDNHPLIDYPSSDDEEDNAAILENANETMMIHFSTDDDDDAVNDEEDDVSVGNDNASDDDCREEAVLETELNHSDEYESGEIRDSDESFHVDDDVPSASLITETPPGKLAPKQVITGFLQKVKFAACNPSLLHVSSTRWYKQQYPTAERRRRHEKIGRDRFMQRTTHNGGIMDEGGFLQITPQGKAELRYTMLIPRYMRSLLHFQGIQANFREDMMKALPLPS